MVVCSRDYLKAGVSNGIGYSIRRAEFRVTCKILSGQRSLQIADCQIRRLDMRLCVNEIIQKRICAIAFVLRCLQLHTVAHDISDKCHR